MVPSSLHHQKLVGNSANLTSSTIRFVNIEVFHEYSSNTVSASGLHSNPTNGAV